MGTASNRLNGVADPEGATLCIMIKVLAELAETSSAPPSALISTDAFILYLSYFIIQKNVIQLIITF